MEKTLNNRGGSQWGGGFYGYRLKLFGSFTAIGYFFSVTVKKKVKN